MSFETVQIGSATLYRGDCMEVLPTLGRFDAVITDDIIRHEKSTNRKSETQQRSGNYLGAQTGRNRQDVSQGGAVSSSIGGALRGGTSGDVQGFATHGNQAEIAGQDGCGEWALHTRDGQYPVSEKDCEARMQSLQFKGAASSSSQEREPFEQQESKFRGALLAVPHKSSQNRMVGAKERIALITDPPYGINAENAGGRGVSGWSNFEKFGWDLKRPSREVFDAMLKASDVQIIWGGNYFADYLPVSQQWLSWDKGQDGFSLADFELAWSSQDKACRRINYPRALALKDGKQHPTQKPLAVMRWCIEQVNPVATHILDPFMGSGTTGVAAIQLGRTFTGIEREPKYFDIACKRIEQAYAQGQLFEPVQAKQEQMSLEANP